METMEKGHGMMGMDDMAMKEMSEHIKMHMQYPATKKAIMEECNNMMHVPEATRMMMADKLPDKTYMSADEVMMAMGM